MGDTQGEMKAHANAARLWPMAPPAIVSIIVASVLVITFFVLPYTSAVGDYRERLTTVAADAPAYRGSSITGLDMADLTLFEIAVLFGESALEEDDISAFVFIALPYIVFGALSCLALLFACLRRPVLDIVFSVLMLAMVGLMRFVFPIDRDDYEWSIASDLCIFVPIAFLGVSIWLTAVKSHNKHVKIALPVEAQASATLLEEGESKDVQTVGSTTVDKSHREKSMALPSILSVIAALVLVVAFFLPYITATSAYRERVGGGHASTMPITVVGDMTMGDTVDLSLFDYARAYQGIAQAYDGALLTGITKMDVLPFAAVFFLGCAALIFALFRRPVPNIVFSVAILATICWIGTGFIQSGVVDGGGFVWGIGACLSLAAPIVLLCMSVWLFLIKKQNYHE